MTTSTTKESSVSRRYEAWYPLHDASQIPWLVLLLHETVLFNHGDLSTALWEVNVNFLDYGYYQLVVTFDLRS